MGIGPIQSTNYFTPVEAASAFGTGALLARPGIVVTIFKENIVTHAEPHVAEPHVTGAATGIIAALFKENAHPGNVHEKVADQNVADGMGVAARAAVVAGGLIVLAKSCVTVASGVVASVLLVTKQAVNAAARPTTATPEL